MEQHFEGIATLAGASTFGITYKAVLGAAASHRGAWFSSPGASAALREIQDRI